MSTPKANFDSRHIFYSPFTFTLGKPIAEVTEKGRFFTISEAIS